MVKSKVRCHLVQYMKNKPCKWDFKYWVIANSSGYTGFLICMLVRQLKKVHMDWHLMWFFACVDLLPTKVINFL